MLQQEIEYLKQQLAQQREESKEQLASGRRMRPRKYCTVQYLVRQ